MKLQKTPFFAPDGAGGGAGTAPPASPSAPPATPPASAAPAAAPAGGASAPPAPPAAAPETKPDAKPGDTPAKAPEKPPEKDAAKPADPQARIAELESASARSAAENRILRAAITAKVADLDAYTALADQARRDQGDKFDLATWTESQKTARPYLFSAAAPPAPPTPSTTTAAAPGAGSPNASIAAEYAAARQRGDTLAMLDLKSKMQRR